MGSPETRPVAEKGDTAFAVLSALAGTTPEREGDELYAAVVDAAVDAGFESAAAVTIAGTVPAANACSITRAEGMALDHPTAVSTVTVGSMSYLAVPVAGDDRRFGTLLFHPAEGVPENEYDTYATIGATLGRRLASHDRATVDTVATQQRTFRKMHSVATRMVGAESEEGVVHLAIDAAENILDFDTCTIDVVDDGYFHPVATSSGIPAEGSERVSVEQGLAGRTYREERSFVIADARENEDVTPVDDAYRSILSIPIEDVGIFQAATTEPNAFDEADADLAELLMSYVSQTITRIRSETALRENEKRYRTLIEQSHDAVLTIRDETVEFANDQATDLFGYDRGTLEGLTVWELVHAADRERVRRTGQDLRHGLRDAVTFGARIVRSDGAVRHCEFSASRIEYREDLSVMVTARDVTERRAYERRLERQNERLDEFASVVSHDLRNPLNVAHGRVALARDTGDVAHLGDALDALDRMNDLVEEVLTWARQGRAVTDPENVDVGTAAKRAWDTVETGPATLAVDLEDLVVEADPRRVRRLFENLFHNAVDHGGDAVSVTVGPLDDGFFVADDGAGIAADELDAVFERGFTTDESGTGFGLAIVQDIATAHGWTVDAVPEGAGARFEIRDVRES